MDMTAAAALIVLFSGQNLDQWITQAGRWEVADKAIVCREAPAALRSCFESNSYILSFKYRGAGHGNNQLVLQASLAGEGLPLHLASDGLWPAHHPASTRPASPGNGWFSAQIRVEADTLHAQTLASDGTELSKFVIPIPQDRRGFIRFDVTEPGIEIRDVVVRDLGFTPLFDGQTLDGWEVVTWNDNHLCWETDHGVLASRADCPGWLRTLRTYEHFVLRLEYRLPPEGNSGIFLRAPGKGNVSHVGMEVQLIDDDGWPGPLKVWQHTGSIYGAVPPDIRVPAPAEQWNAIEVLCDHRRMRTILNGVQLYDVSADDASRDMGVNEHPLSARQKVGFIGLQYHSHPCAFRHVRIQELP